MALTTLHIDKLRVLHNVSFKLAPHINYFVGDNGAGKTSLLEAAHMLSVGRSFRTTKTGQLIAKGHEKLLVYGESSEGRAAGLEKSNSGHSRIKLDGEICRSQMRLAEWLPILLINHESIKLVETNNTYRRQLLDWCVFHVEHPFREISANFSQVLKQRNAALKAKSSPADCKAWDLSLIELACQIDFSRKQVFESLKDEIYAQLSSILPSVPFKLEFYSGWPSETSLETTLAEAYWGDLKRGYTQFGPHRADICITVEEQAIYHLLSRGQLKRVAYCLRIAQAKFLMKHTSKKAVFLIDDLPSELDADGQFTLLSLLKSLTVQVLVTGALLNTGEYKIQHESGDNMFHVEHGRITEA